MISGLCVLVLFLFQCFSSSSKASSGLPDLKRLRERRETTFELSGSWADKGLSNSVASLQDFLYSAMAAEFNAIRFRMFCLLKPVLTLMTI